MDLHSAVGRYIISTCNNIIQIYIYYKNVQVCKENKNRNNYILGTLYVYFFLIPTPKTCFVTDKNVYKTGFFYNRVIIIIVIIIFY